MESTPTEPAARRPRARVPPLPDGRDPAGDLVRPLRGLSRSGAHPLQEVLPESRGVLSECEGFPLDRPGGPRGPDGDPRRGGGRREPAPAGLVSLTSGRGCSRRSRSGRPAEDAAVRRRAACSWPPGWPGRSATRSSPAACARGRAIDRGGDARPAGRPGGPLVGSAGGRSPRGPRRLPAAPPGARNVVLIVWDTVRASNLSLYGYPRDTTPNLAAWARKGVRYNRALAPAPWTFPSHSSFFTGQWPFRLDSQWKFTLDAPDPTLAEIPGLAGLSDRRVRGEHQLLQLRDRAGSGLRPLRGLPADAAVPPRSHGPRRSGSSRTS